MKKTTVLAKGTDDGDQGKITYMYRVGTWNPAVSIFLLKIFNFRSILVYDISN